MPVDQLSHSSHTVIIGDSRRMAEAGDESVHLVVTSPPYWQLKDYGCDKQIGFDDSYEEYINNLNLVWHECYRTLHKSCRLCINIGDQFARSVYYGRYKVIPIRTEIIRFCETIGFDYMGAIIWQKVTTCNTSGGGAVMGSYPFPRNGILKIDYEFILLFKKLGKAPRPNKETKEASRMSHQEWNEYFQGHWNFAGEKQASHLAMFPEELPRRLIKMFSFVGETVLDPFLGSGTTILAAMNLKRNALGYEINNDFVPVIEKKLRMNQKSLFEAGAARIIHRDSSNGDYERELRQLPYLFQDPIRFDKKVDPRKLEFGSRINSASAGKREDFHRVKEVLATNLVVLDSGFKIRLLGIKSKPGREEDAIEFLREKTRSQKVFMKFDDAKHNDEDIPLCYLYLANKTFLNAHLLKHGLALPDTAIEYKHRDSFINKAAENAEATDELPREAVQLGGAPA